MREDRELERESSDRDAWTEELSDNAINTVVETRTFIVTRFCSVNSKIFSN